MQSYPKNKRFEDKNLLKEYHNKPCVICSSTPCDPCHIISKGAGGGDTKNNLLPMCREHHSESHQIGWASIVKKHPILGLALMAKGFEFDNNRLVNINNKL